MDEIALPIVLAWWLGRTSADDWAHIKRAADYSSMTRPAPTGQERWENQGGWSPNTIATEIAGLICAADVARKNGDEAGGAVRGQRRRRGRQGRVLDRHETDGPYSPQPYYLRVTKDGNPNDGTTYGLGDNFPRPVDQREIVDNSFLGLVLSASRSGTTRRSSTRSRSATTQLAVDTPSGPSGTASRSTATASRRTAATGTSSRPPPRQTHGRLWPLLAGERGEYELLAGRRTRARACARSRTPPTTA